MQTPLSDAEKIFEKFFDIGVSRRIRGYLMPSVTVQDLWLTPAATPDIRRAVAKARDPKALDLPDGAKTARYGVGRRWRCSWRIPRPGGGYRQQTKAFDTRAEADAFAVAQEAQLRSGIVRDIHAGERWFKDVAGMWLASKTGLGGATKARYERELRVWVLPRWGEYQLADITTPELQGWVLELSEGTAPHAYKPRGKKPRTAKPLAARSIKSIVKVVCAGVLDYAVESGWIAQSPMARVSLPAVHEAADMDDRVYLTRADVDKLADAIATGRVGARKGHYGPRWTDVDHAQDRLICMVLAYTGMRVGEAFALRGRDIDLDTRRIRIRQTWTTDGGRLVLGPPKTRKPRTIALPGMLVDDLRRQIAGPEDFVFRAPRGGAWEVNNWRSRVWRPAIEALGWQDTGITIHSLRHTYASWAIAAGADVKTLQAQLGHSSATITLDTYAALWPDRLGQIAEAVAAAPGVSQTAKNRAQTPQ